MMFNYGSQEADDNRIARRCLGCGGHKDSGCIVCWGCFKSGSDGFKQHKDIRIPLKYFPQKQVAEDKWEDEWEWLNRWLKVAASDETWDRVTA